MAANKSLEKRFKKLKYGHPILAVIFYFIVCQLFLAVLAMLLVAFFTYAVDSKLSGEIDSVRYLAGIYEEYGKNGQMEVLLEATGRNYIVRDPKGKILYQKGENTVGEQAGIPEINLGGLIGQVGISMSPVDETKEFRIYGDTALPFFLVREDGEVHLSFEQLKAGLKGKSLWQLLDSDTDVNTQLLEMPLWVATDAADGNELLGRVSISMQYKDLATIVIISIALGLFGVLVFLLFVISIIRNLRRQKKLTEFFFMDAVTGGQNWMSFLINTEKDLKKGSNAGKSYAMIHLAIVKYRNYIMCHSINEGEDLLRRIHNILNRYITKKEYCAHVTSGSFALMLQMNDEESLRNRLKGMLQQLETVDQVHHFAFQIGVYVIEPNVEYGKFRRRRTAEPEDYYNNACSAKATLESGDDSGIAFFDQQLVNQRKWEDAVNELQEAALANEEFIVYYQPKYAPDTEELKGAEALVRWKPLDPAFFENWKHMIPPGKELVPPGMFIPIFEKNGFITKIDHYMLEHVAKDQKAWLDAGYPCVPVSVNVSRAHFAEPDLAEQIRDTVDKIGTPHELIEIELTESAFFDDKNALVCTIERLKSYGFSVSMDDFGAGYSSLNSLKDMALDVLKLDAEFFRGDADEERKQIVVGEAIRLAKNLNMRVVAEGVEAKEQVEFLAGAGCDMIQGFIFARPMEKDKYMQRMQGIRDEEEGPG